MISHKIAVHQLIDVCTTRVVHVHISCWTSAQQLLCDRRSYIYQRHILYLRKTSIISSEDFCIAFPNAFMSAPHYIKTYKLFQ